MLCHVKFLSRISRGTILLRTFGPVRPTFGAVLSTARTETLRNKTCDVCVSYLSAASTFGCRAISYGVIQSPRKSDQDGNVRTCQKFAGLTQVLMVQCLLRIAARSSGLCRVDYSVMGSVAACFRIFRTHFGIALTPKTPRIHPHAVTPLTCLLYTSPSPRDATLPRMPSSA